jgi:hypothetical protein
MSKLITTIGPLTLKGEAPGDGVIAIARNQDIWNYAKGSTGEDSRSEIGDKSGTAFLKLLRASRFNAELSALILADETTKIGIFPFFIEDLLGFDKHGGIDCSFKGYPKDGAYGEGADNQLTYEIYIPNYDLFFGGNSS